MQESSRGADITARTNVYTYLCTQANRLKHVRTLLIGYRSGGTLGILRNLRARDWIAGRRRGSNACQRPSNLPALRVARRCSPVGFDRQHTCKHKSEPWRRLPGTTLASALKIRSKSRCQIRSMHLISMDKACNYGNCFN